MSVSQQGECFINNYADQWTKKYLYKTKLDDETSEELKFTHLFSF
jgi:hypothetical protein